ncbi:MAG TPA: ParB/RepB/Spo0J family partition protein [Ilumatobacter sp.]
MARRSGLGRGLSSLIPPGPVEGATSNGADRPYLTDIPVADIGPNPHQPRVHFDEESLIELASSIAQIGVLQPILVRPVADDRFELIAGERRWRAAGRAGLATIPAIVRTGDDLGSVEKALIENLHRQDLTPLEEAAAFQQLIEDFGLTHEQVADRIGKSRSAVSNTLRLLGLPPAVQHYLADGKLSAGHARAVLGTPDRVLQEELARLIVEEGWTVRTVEEAVRHGGVLPVAEPPAPDGGRRPGTGTIAGAGLTPSTKLRPPGLLELEELLAGYLDTRVTVQMGVKRGKVAIEFADLEDLERIYRQITHDPD